MAHTHNYDTTSNIKIAFFLNLFFALFEIGGAIYTNSLALLSNGLHDAGDTLSLGLSLFLNTLARKERNDIFSYGYKRLSLAAAFLNSLILIASSLFILSEAIPRLMNPQHSNATGMILFAIIGLGVNFLGYVRLNKGKTMSDRVAALHLFDDVLGLSAVLLISIIIKFYDTHILDPLLSICITLYVLSKVIKQFRKTINLFLQATPDEISVVNIEKALATITGVHGIHDTHVWSLDGEHNILSSHIIVRNHTSHEEMVRVKRKAKEVVEKMDIFHSTIEIECEDETCNTTS